MDRPSRLPDSLVLRWGEIGFDLQRLLQMPYRLRYSAHRPQSGPRVIVRVPDWNNSRTVQLQVLKQ